MRRGPGVLIVSNFFASSRFGRSVGEDLAVRLAAAGLDVTTTSCEHRPIRRLLEMVSTAWRCRSRYEVAVIEVYSGRAFLWAEAVSFVARLLGKPVVLALHGGRLPGFARRWPRRVKALLQSASVVVAPSPYLRELMRPYRDDIALLPNAIESSRYEYRRRSPALPRLVWLRAFHEIYDPSMAVELVARLAMDMPDISLEMVGPDKGDGSLQRATRRAEELGVRDRIRFVGGVPKSEVPDRLQGGDIFLVTSTVDNTPVSVLEAMACGLCVVSTDVGGMPFLLDDGVDALLSPSGDVPAMADSVRRLLHDDGLAGRLSSAGHAKAVRFGWSAVIPQWTALLGHVAGARLSTELAQQRS